MDFVTITHWKNVLKSIWRFGKLSLRPLIIAYRKSDESSELDMGSDINIWALCNKARIPLLKGPFHLIFGILNFVIPGLGTMLSAFPSFQEPIAAD
jgi:hypothetical protein